MAVALYSSYLAYLTIGLDFSLLRSDVLTYWNESLTLETPSLLWVPGYPFLIACVRAVTLGMLPPTAVMVLISGVSYVIGVHLVAAVAAHLGLKHPKRVALIFGAYPLVGLTYSVWPVSDTLATTLLLGSYLAFERRRWTSFTVCAACALMAHKAMWFFVPCLMLLAFIRHRESRLVVPLACVPLLAWLVMGAIHYGDMLWFVRWPVQHLVVSRGHLPVLDGLLGPFLDGDLAKVTKGLVIVTIVGVVSACGYLSLRAGYWPGLALTVPIVVLAIALNQYRGVGGGSFQSRAGDSAGLCCGAHTVDAVCSG